MRRWSKKEDDFLRKNYKVKSISTIKSKLHDRSENTIRWRAKKLELTEDRGFRWSPEEIKLLQSKKPTTEIVKITGRSYTAVNKKRQIIATRENEVFQKTNLSDYFDLSAIEKGVPKIQRFSKSSTHLALLKAMKVGESYEYPANEMTLVRNQIQLISSRNFETKKWTETTRRVWRIK